VGVFVGLGPLGEFKTRRGLPRALVPGEDFAAYFEGAVGLAIGDWTEADPGFSADFDGDLTVIGLFRGFCGDEACVMLYLFGLGGLNSFGARFELGLGEVGPVFEFGLAPAAGILIGEPNLSGTRIGEPKLIGTLIGEPIAVGVDGEVGTPGGGDFGLVKGSVRINQGFVQVNK